MIIKIRFIVAALVSFLPCFLGALLLIFALYSNSLEAIIYPMLALILISCFSLNYLYKEKEEFFLSSGFWVGVTIIFYIILRSIYDVFIMDSIDYYIAFVFFLTLLFLFSFVLGYLACSISRGARTKILVNIVDITLTQRQAILLLLIFILFKYGGVLLIMISVSGNILDISLATQNMGASYIYLILNASNLFFIIIMYYKIRYNKYSLVFYSSIFVFFSSAIFSGSRYSIALAFLWWLFLVNKYVRPVPLLLLSMLSLPLFVIFSLFGISRELEVMSFEAINVAISHIIENPVLIFNVLVSRLDMLSQITEGLRLYYLDEFQPLHGKSLIFAILHFIPRPLWEEKPLLTTALVTSHTLPGAFADGVNIFSSILMEGMLNFGILGVLIWGVVVGILSQIFDKLLHCNNSKISIFAVLFISFPMGLFNEGFHSNYFGAGLYVLFIYFFTFAILQRCSLIGCRVYTPAGFN